MSKIKAFTMPKWGIEMQEGTIAEWLTQEGQAFAKGDLLALIETDKISNEVEAEFDSTLRLIVSPPGKTQPVGALLGVFAEEGVSDDEVKAFADSFEMADTSTAVGNSSEAAEAAKAETKAEAKPESKPVPAPSDNLNISPKARELAIELGVDTNLVEGSGRQGRITYQDIHQAARPDAKPALKGALAKPDQDESIFASPLAKRLAALNNIDLKSLTGTGPRGRICKADVLAKLPAADMAADTAATTAPVSADNTPDIVEMSKIRKVIARRLTEAKSTIPHFYIRNEFAVDALMEFRRIANKVLNTKASLNDYLIKAIGRALVEHPDVNVQVHGDDIHHFPHADIAVAIASKNGLITPIVRNVDLQSIGAISSMTSGLIKRANTGKIKYDELEGGTLTISNLGMMGVEQFDAIINPPQGSILAIGGIKRVWSETEDGSGAFMSKMPVAMSCDHRAIDGAAGAKFMATLQSMIEDPASFF